MGKREEDQGKASKSLFFQKMLVRLVGLNVAEYIEKVAQQGLIQRPINDR